MSTDPSKPRLFGKLLSSLAAWRFAISLQAIAAMHILLERKFPPNFALQLITVLFRKRLSFDRRRKIRYENRQSTTVLSPYFPPSKKEKRKKRIVSVHTHDSLRIETV